MHTVQWSCHRTGQIHNLGNSHGNTWLNSNSSNTLRERNSASRQCGFKEGWNDTKQC